MIGRHPCELYSAGSDVVINAVNSAQNLQDGWCVFKLNWHALYIENKCDLESKTQVP